LLAALEQSIASSSYVDKFSFTDAASSDAASNGSSPSTSSPFEATIEISSPSFAAAADVEDALRARSDIFSTIELKNIVLTADTGRVATQFLIGIKPELVAFNRSVVSGTSPVSVGGMTETQMATSTGPVQ
jgi:hypothetical protein